MAPQTPLLLWDNVFDTVTLYPGGVLDASSETTTREAFRVADYRRERSWWKPTGDASPNGNWVRVDLGSGVTRGVDFLMLDRGHGAWGRTVTLEGGPDGNTWDVSQAFTVPTQGTLGGSNLWPAMAVTEEGAVYSLKATPLAARRWWRFRVNYVASLAQNLTGIQFGLKTQLLGFSRVYDEDAGERTETTERSRAGYRGTDRTYSGRTIVLDLAMIGAAEYDGAMRTLRQVLFHQNQPAWVFMDYETYPARGWLYQYDGRGWAMPKTRVHRAGVIRMVEVGPLLA
jgi:hypothetical protein